jgi:hypothetical protein
MVRQSSSMFEIKNKEHQMKLKELIKVLFPYYSYVSIKKNGVIKLGKKVFFNCIPKIQLEIHVSELCISMIPVKLSEYRQGNKRYAEVYNKYLEYIIYYHKCNIIDYLYDELLRIKSSSRVDILIENAQLFLPQTESGQSITTIGTIFSNNVPQKERLKDTLELLRNWTKESLIDQYNRLSFIS